MKKLKVLIVDDSSVMRKIIERALRQAGLDLSEVLEASNGAEGLAALEKGALDISSISNFQGLNLKCQGLARDLCFFERIRWLTWIAEDRHAGDPGKRLFE